MKKILLMLICLFVSFEVKAQGIFRIPHKECVELIKKGKQITQHNEMLEGTFYIYTKINYLVLF